MDYLLVMFGVVLWFALMMFVVGPAMDRWEHRKR